MTSEHELAVLRQRLEAIAPAERLDYLAALPAGELTKLKRILSRDDVKKLNHHIDALTRQRRKPTIESWLAQARAGQASTPEAMIEALREIVGRMPPKDADWIRRIDDTASAGGFSKRQREVIGAIYASTSPKGR